MQAWSWVQHHRWLSIVFLVIVMLVVAGGTCWAVFFRTVASPVSLRDALRLYRHDQTVAADTGADDPGSAAIEPTRPLTPGVFSYRTSGSESLSIPGSDRSFPTHSAMVVSDGASGCSAVDWVPIMQHTETTTVCPSPDHSLVISDFVTYEQISGSTTTSVIDCPATAYLVPPGAGAGARWSATCHQTSPSEDVVVHGLDMGQDDVDVGGQAVGTVHVQLTLQFEGVDAGTDPTDFWISMSKGVVVREQEVASLSQSGVHYSEKMSTLLTSLTPSS